MKAVRNTILILGVLLLLFFLFGEKMSGPNVSLNGISPVKLVDDIYAKYDINADELLSVTGESFLRSDLEGVLKTESHGLLFTDADNFGDGNGIVTKQELGQFISEFDQDGNGELTTYTNIINSMIRLINGEKSEWYTFDQKYGERYKYE